MFKRAKEQQGFTLIELMIVIAIIGILAAIAIPNFISYRNKSYCTAVEADATAVASAVANYFSNPRHTKTPTFADLKPVPQLSYGNTVTTLVGADPNANITIIVTDGTKRCPNGTNYTINVGKQGGTWN